MSRGIGKSNEIIVIAIKGGLLVVYLLVAK